jgi:hypothetical protein
MKDSSSWVEYKNDLFLLFSPMAARLGCLSDVVSGRTSLMVLVDAKVCCFFYWWLVFVLWVQICSFVDFLFCVGWALFPF